MMGLLELLIPSAQAQVANVPETPLKVLFDYGSSQLFLVDAALAVAVVVLFKVYARWPTYERWLVAGTLILFSIYPAIVYPAFNGGSFWQALAAPKWFTWVFPFPMTLLGLWIFLKFRTSLLTNPHQTAGVVTPAARLADAVGTAMGARPGTAAEGIFLSYRREDSADVTGRIYDRLVQRFGKGQIFKDVDSIPLGVDFRHHLGDVIGRCSVVLVVIGDRWADASKSGLRRLDDATDFVRIELEAALDRKVPVVPVLVRGATIPSDSDLPASLRALAFRNGIAVRPDPDFHRDMDRLIAGLEVHLPH